jgi:AraC-like DNA-binding protein/ligand-binding sensor protein
MNTVSVQDAGLLPAMKNQAGNIRHKEIDPLLTKALQVVVHYDRAMDLSSMVLDGSCQVIKTIDYEKQMRFCELCRKNFFNSSQIWQGGDTYPCTKVHFDAFAESRCAARTHIYACHVGFGYWTSPLYRNGRFAGALSSGQVLMCGRNEAVEKFRDHCKDQMAVEKFRKLLDYVPEKDHEEIKAMAGLLEVCAEEISEKEKDPNFTIRCSADSEYPLEKERMLLAAFKRGDNETGSRILKELIESTSAAIPEDFEIIRIRAIQLLVLLSKTASESSPGDVELEANAQYLRRIQDSKSTKELIENLQIVAGRLAVKMFSFHGIRHASVLRKAERYIWDNFNRKISLEETAKASGLSAPYFSSVFKEEMGENFSNYLNRLRVERAAVLLTGTRKPLSEIAKLCGFEDQSWFSKIFKKITGTSPGKYRRTL